MATSTIESVLQEKRVFPPAAAFVKQANISGMEAYRKLVAEFERDFQGTWGRLARETLHWSKPFTKVLDESKAPFFRWFYDGELNASYNCLDRHLKTQPRQDRDHLRGRRRQGDEDHLPAAVPGGLQVRERAQGERHQAGRPRPDLHADVDPGGGRDAGVRAHRRNAFGGVRRLLGEERAGAHHRCRRHRGDHRRRPVPRRARDPAEARGRRGARHGRLRGDQERHRLQALGQQGADAGRARHLVGRRGEGPGRYLRADLRQRRASALHPVHLGLDRQAEGHPAFHRRVSACGARSP